MTQHQQNGQTAQTRPVQFSENPKRDHFEELIEDGTKDDEQPPRGTQNLLGKDFVLGNISKEDRRAWWWLAKNQQEFAEAEHPPKGSMVQGPIRAALLGDPKDRKTVITPEKLTDEHSELLAFEARASRSEGGFQQKKLGEQRRVQRMEDARYESQQDENKGILGGIFS